MAKICFWAFLFLLFGCGTETASHQFYANYLAGQVKQELRLPTRLIKKLQPWFQTDLTKVRYAVNINTVSGKIITINNRIYFPNNMTFFSRKAILKLLHELEHVEQYARAGESFMTNYTLQSIISTSTQVHSPSYKSIHDNMKWEKEANLKAQNVFDSIARSSSQSHFEKPSSLK